MQINKDSVKCIFFQVNNFVLHRILFQLVSLTSAILNSRSSPDMWRAFTLSYTAKHFSGPLGDDGLKEMSQK